MREMLSLVFFLFTLVTGPGAFAEGDKIESVAISGVACSFLRGSKLFVYGPVGETIELRFASFDACKFTRANLDFELKKAVARRGFVVARATINAGGQVTRVAHAHVEIPPGRN